MSERKKENVPGRGVTENTGQERELNDGKMGKEDKLIS